MCLPLGFKASHVFYLEEHIGKLCSVACVLYEEMGSFSPSDQFYRVSSFLQTLNVFVPPVKEKEVQAGEEMARPGVQEAAVQGPWLLLPGGKIT